MRGIGFAWAFLVALTGPASGDFTLDDSGSALRVLESGKPVLVYHYAPVAPPAGVPEHFSRSCYIHPLYGLNGDVVTEDFPADHYHHRGVFWAWPECTAGGRRLDVWALENVRPRHEAWVQRTAGPDTAEVAVTNIWSYDEAPTAPVVREQVRFVVHRATEQGRAIDFDLTFTNAHDCDVTFLGAKDKGYGGFCLRPDAARKPFTFTSAQGVSPEDVLRCETPWADVSWSAGPAGPASGAAIFEHPGNPGYPFPGWMFRHYGFLGASWPHEQPYTLKPGESFRLRYRLYLHRGSAADANIGETFRTYERENR